MKKTTIIGIVLVVLGCLALVYDSFEYTEKETIMKVGPIEAQAEQRESIPIPPIVGGLVVAAGLFLIVFASRK